MTDDCEWGPWIDHDGLSIPLPHGAFVEAEFRDGHVVFDNVRNPPPPNRVSAFIWAEIDLRYGYIGMHIVRYRVRKPRSKAMDVLRAVANGGKIDGRDDPVRVKPARVAIGDGSHLRSAGAYVRKAKMLRDAAKREG